MISNNDNNNLRCVYNRVGVLYTSGRKSKRLRGQDINDKSRQYYATIRIANTYNKTEYVKTSGGIIKLKSFIAQLRHNKNKWYIDPSREYITTNENGITTYKISYTNACVVKNNTTDKKQRSRIYNGK